MRPVILLILAISACTAIEPEPEIICTTHSIAETGGGLTECHEVSDD